MDELVTLEDVGDPTEQEAQLLPSAHGFQLMTAMAKSYYDSHLLPGSVKNWQGALLVMQKGIELGLKATVALSSVHIIEGKPTLGADLMRTLILRDHGDSAFMFEVTTPTECAIRYKRRSWDQPKEFTYTIEDAARASLTDKPNWKKFPAEMLRARATSTVARMAFPDSIAGMYSIEEMSDGVVIDEVPLAAATAQPGAGPSKNGASAPPSSPTPPQGTGKQNGTADSVERPDAEQLGILKELAESIGVVERSKTGQSERDYSLWRLLWGEARKLGIHVRKIENISKAQYDQLYGRLVDIAKEQQREQEETVDAEYTVSEATEEARPAQSAAEI